MAPGGRIASAGQPIMTIEPLLLLFLKHEVVRSPRITEALRSIPLNAILPPGTSAGFLQDRPVPVYESDSMVRTTGAPHMIVTMLEHLELAAGMKALIVGGKGGVLEALVIRLVAPGPVHVVDSDPAITEVTRIGLRAAGLDSAATVVVVGDPLAGLPDSGPYDRILVTAQIDEVPTGLVQQLTPDGWLLAPVGPPEVQQLLRVRREGDVIATAALGEVCFGPLV